MCPFCWIATVTMVALASILLCSIVLVTDGFGWLLLLLTGATYYLQESGYASNKPLWFIIAYGVLTALALIRAVYLLCTKRRSWIQKLWQGVLFIVVKPVCNGFRSACGIPQTKESDTLDSEAEEES